MEKSLAEGSQTFEQDLARLITEGAITRDEGLAYADSPTNLMWRLQNDMTPVSRVAAEEGRARRPPSFTEITLDVRPRRAHDARSRAACGAAERAAAPDVADAAARSKQLIARRSVTPDDGGCQALIAERLRAARLRLRDASPCGPDDVPRHQPVGAAPRRAAGADAACFAGHTDVVPTGPLDAVDAATRSCRRTATASCTAAAPPT